MKNRVKNMVVIGSGNVAWHLIRAFGRKGIQPLQVLARNEKSARALSELYAVPFITDPRALNKEADLYLMAVQDGQISETARHLDLKDQLLIHTSGFSGINLLEGASANTGVLWPLQTLTQGKETNLDHVPFFIEASPEENLELLFDFASLVSSRVVVTDSPTRQKIHLAAVIASNLTNHLYSIAASILERQEIPFDVLKPLILETAEKATRKHPLNSQTGPAARNDLRVIEKHLELLRNETAYRDIYRMISENIIYHHSSKNG